MKTEEQNAADILLEHISIYAMYDRFGEEFTDAFIDELGRISDGTVLHGRVESDGS